MYKKLKHFWNETVLVNVNIITPVTPLLEYFKGLTKFHIAKIKKVSGSWTQTAVISCLTRQNWKIFNVTKICWIKVEDWYFHIPTEIMMPVAQPMKAHVIYQSLNESIVMSYYLLRPVHQWLTDLFFTITMTDLSWSIKSRIQTTSLAPMFGMLKQQIFPSKITHFQC